MNAMEATVNAAAIYEELEKQEAEMVKLLEQAHAEHMEQAQMSDLPNKAGRENSRYPATMAVAALKRGDMTGAEKWAQKAYDSDDGAFHFKELLYAVGRVHRAKEAVRSYGGIKAKTI